MSYFDKQALTKLTETVVLVLADGKTRKILVGAGDVHQIHTDAPVEMQQDLNDLCSANPVRGYLAPHFYPSQGWRPHWSFIISRRQF